jgi:integrase
MKPFKKCNCRDEGGKRLGRHCPQLITTDAKGRTRYNPNHGAWWVRYEAPSSEGGNRRRPWLGPFDTQADAKHAVEDLDSNTKRYGWADNRTAPLSEHLDWMLQHHFGPDRTTQRYQRAKSAIELYFRPGLGHIRLCDLTPDHVYELVAAMRRVNRDEDNPNEMLRRLLDARATWAKPADAAYDGLKRPIRVSDRPLTDATIKRNLVVLSAALNHDRARKTLPVNPVARVKLNAQGDKPKLWTVERVARWKQTGAKPGKVLVWTREMAGAFLDTVADDRLYALWHLAIHWGPRRGELVSLVRSDVQTSARRITIQGTKSDDAKRTFGVDQGTADVLSAWFDRQMEEQLAAGDAWQDSGRVFTHEDGTPLTPHYVTKRFIRLLRASGLPPVRLHDLRHGAATYLIHDLGGVNNPAAIKTVQHILGHASFAFTSDVYAVIEDEMADKAAEVAAVMIPRRGAS